MTKDVTGLPKSVVDAIMAANTAQIQMSNEGAMYPILCAPCLFGINIDICDSEMVGYFCSECRCRLAQIPKLKCAGLNDAGCGNPRYVNALGVPGDYCTVCYKARHR